MINRDTNNINISQTDVEIGTKVKASIDHRLFTEEGRNQIKKDFETSKEHAEDLSKAIATVATNENIGISNIVEQGRDNIASTKVKDFLEDTQEGQEIVKALKADKNSKEYQDAKVKAIHKLQEFRGIEKSEIVHYDAKTTEQELLKDIVGVVDTQGVTLTNGENKGTIVLDVSGDKNNKSDKQSNMEVAGHEVGESKYLQNGNGLVFKDSYETKEAMNDLLGENFTSRINEATNGAITSTKTTAVTNSYIELNTNRINNLDVRNDGVEYRQVAPEEKTFINNNAKKYAEKNNISEIEAKKELFIAARTLVDTQDNNLITKIIDKEKTSTKTTDESLKKAQEFLLTESKGQTFMDGLENPKKQLFTDIQKNKDKHNLIPNTQQAVKDMSLTMMPVGGILKSVDAAKNTAKIIAKGTKGIINTSSEVISKTNSLVLGGTVSGGVNLYDQANRNDGNLTFENLNKTELIFNSATGSYAGSAKTFLGAIVKGSTAAGANETYNQTINVTNNSIEEKAIEVGKKTLQGIGFGTSIGFSGFIGNKVIKKTGVIGKYTKEPLNTYKQTSEGLTGVTTSVLPKLMDEEEDKESE